MSWDHFPAWIHPDLWLDADHALEFTTHEDASAPTRALFIHRDKRNPERWCVGAFQWASPSGPNWTLVSREPFHVEPSIKCGCGEHGHIRNGEWQPC